MPEKGLHLLLRALPAIRQRVSDATVTIIAGQGSSGYRQMTMQTIARHRLEDVVTFLPPVERAALQTAYATHDVLFFHSIYAEPVSLALMEAFAAGLPVVASQACPESKLVKSNVTCLCYRPNNTGSLIEAVVTMLADGSTRRRVAANAQELVRNEFSLDRMGRAYDEALRQFPES